MKSYATFSRKLATALPERGRRIVRLVAASVLTFVAPMFGPATAAAATVEIGPGDLVTPPAAGWWFFDESTPAPPHGAGSMVFGPATPPLGLGSARMVLDATAGGRLLLGTLDYAGTRFDEITNLQYSTYRASADAGNNLAISLQFEVDYDLSDLGTAFQGRLVFEPYLTPGVGGTVISGTWQTWSPLAGRWWASNVVASGGLCPQASPCTWAQVLANWPNGGLRDAGPGTGGLLLKAGAPWPSFDGNVDALTVGVLGADTTYDFEPCATRHVATTGSDAANDCYDGGAPCATIQHAIAVACPGDTIEVASGSYVENVTLAKSVTIEGAQAGVDACDRVASESIVAPAAGVGLTLQTGSAGARIDGLTFSGGTIGILSTSGPLNGLELRNNRIVAFTANGVFLNDTGTSITVDQNEIDGTSKTGGGGLFHLDTDNFNGLHFTNNCVVNGATATGLFVDGNHNVGVGSRTPLISGNLIDANQTGMNLGSRAFTGGTISGNIFSNNIADGLQGGIQLTAITSNLFTDNGRHGLALTSFGSMAADRGGQNSTVTNNCFIGNGFVSSGAGLFFSASQAPGTIATNSASNNNLFGNATGALYGGAEIIDVDQNWWGCPTGPNTGICDTASLVLDTVPFLSAPASGTACAGCTSDAQCADGLVCNGPETCNTGSGMCQAGTPPTCGYGGADPQCNTTPCIEPGGCAVVPVADGTSCDSMQDMCTLLDSCQTGTCANDGGGGDPDNDNLCSADDNCASDANPGQEDLDSDGDGDVCDPSDAAGLSLRRAQVTKAPGTGRDSWSAQAEIDTTLTPNFISVVDTGGLIVAIADDNGAPIDDETFTAAECTSSGGGNILRCKNASGSQVRFSRRLSAGFYRVVISVKKQSLVLPLVADTPLYVTVTNPVSIDRVDSVNSCQLRAKRVICVELP